MAVPSLIRNLYPSVKGKKLRKAWESCIREAKLVTGEREDTKTFTLARDLLKEKLPEKDRKELKWKVENESPTSS